MRPGTRGTRSRRGVEVVLALWLDERVTGDPSYRCKVDEVSIELTSERGKGEVTERWFDRGQR